MRDALSTDFDLILKSKGEGGDVFISHSHKDFEYVRLVRNSLEEDGFSPLCFYLKCLSDEEEIVDLIKREIDVRSIFIYVDSENARKSRWVQMEREYIQRNGRIVNRVINVDEDDPFLITEYLKDSLRVVM